MGVVGVLLLGASAAPSATAPQEPTREPEPAGGRYEYTVAFESAGGAASGAELVRVVEERFRRASAAEAARVSLSEEGHLIVELDAEDGSERARLRDVVEADDHLLELLVEPELEPEELEEERRRLENWRSASPGRPLDAFHRLDRAEGGPAPDVRWIRRAGEVPSIDGPFQRRPERPEWCFGVRDLESVGETFDDMGCPTASLVFRAGRARAFQDMTGRHAGRRMGIVFDGELLSAPTIAEALPGALLLSRPCDADLAEERRLRLERAVARARELPLPARLVRVAGPR